MLLCEANAKVLEKLRKAGSLDALEAGDYCETLAQALKTVTEIR